MTESMQRTAFDTFTALNAFCVTHRFDVHLAVAQAGAAVITFFLIDTHTEQGDFVEEAVKSSQRAQKSAKTAKDKNGGCKNQNQEHHFPAEKSACNLS